MKTFVLVGGGLAAQNTLFFLLELLSAHPPSVPWRILQFESPSLAPPCSLNTTSLCALRGAKEGTPRGNDLIHGYFAAKNFCEKFHPLGVEKGMVASLCPPHHSYEGDFRRRFGESIVNVQSFPFWSGPLESEVLAVTEEALFFDPELFIQWMNEKMREMVEKMKGRVLWEKITAQVQEICPQGEVILLRDEFGHYHKAHHALFCTGAYTKLFESLFPPSLPIQASQVQSGSYLEFANQDLGEKSWAINLCEKKILLYRHQSKKLLLTGGHVEGAQWCPPFQDLFHIYQEFFNLFHSAFSVPAWEEAKVKTGLRQKGIKRRPFWGELMRTSQGACLYGMFSLYKNGLSYSFLGAKDLAPKLHLEFLKEN